LASLVHAICGRFGYSFRNCYHVDHSHCMEMSNSLERNTQQAHKEPEKEGCVNSIFILAVGHSNLCGCIGGVNQRVQNKAVHQTTQRGKTLLIIFGSECSKMWKANGCLAPSEQQGAVDPESLEENPKPNRWISTTWHLVTFHQLGLILLDLPFPLIILLTLWRMPWLLKRLRTEVSCFMCSINGNFYSVIQRWRED
jgi:hypothetical protein